MFRDAFNHVLHSVITQLLDSQSFILEVNIVTVIPVNIAHLQVE